MSRKKQIKIVNKVMAKIKKGQTKMKPKIFFILGSIALVLGIIGTLVVLSFGVSIISLSIRSNSYMFPKLKMLMILRQIPWWAPSASIIGTITSFLLLKNYDFSYKKNFGLIVVLVILSAIFVGWILNYSNLDRLLFNKGPMRRFYQQKIYQNLPQRGPLKLHSGLRNYKFR